MTSAQEHRSFPIVVAACLAVVACSSASEPDPVTASFPQGVASADPRPESVVIWTRVVTGTGLPETVSWEVSTDSGFSEVVSSGEATTDESRDYTVRVVVGGLRPRTRYYYRFESHSDVSDTGRTLTAPGPDDDAAIRLAVAYGQGYVGRYFNSWKVLAEQDPDIDFVLFLGDYVYEADRIDGALDPTPDRHLDLPDGMEIEGYPGTGKVAWTLEDYRTLYRTWRSDEDLREAHRLFPFITVWDDHEFANDCWQDHANDFNGAKGDEKETARREAATRAWYEYVPTEVNLNPGAGFPDDILLYRSFRFGRHVELFLTDQRYYRDDGLIPEGPPDPEVGKVGQNTIVGSHILVLKDVYDEREAEAAPTMLGAAQMDWLTDGIRNSGATWKLIGSPTLMSQMVLALDDVEELPAFLRKTFYFKVDQWDGYRSERASLLSEFAGIEDVVVLTGDLHASFASELRTDFDSPGAEAVAVEYMGPSISSVSLWEQLALAVNTDPLLSALGLESVVDRADELFLMGNPYFNYANTGAYGYAVVQVEGGKELGVDFVHVPDVLKPGVDSPVERVRFRTPGGSNRIESM